MPLLRRVEAAHLKISDIDCQRMDVHILEGKGSKDRDVMLSPKLLTRYVHAVFTLSRELAPLALQNKRLTFDPLFHASAETLLEVARNPRHLGVRSASSASSTVGISACSFIPMSTESSRSAALPRTTQAESPSAAPSSLGSSGDLLGRS